jgi:glucose/arabinose dehydrogenase
MNVKPIEQGDNAEGPGVIYFGDVGEGGYEEVNAVTEAGQNFGWPCWEGPLPMPRIRDSPLGVDNLTCGYMYQNVKTELPFFFWSRLVTVGYYGNGC